MFRISHNIHIPEAEMEFTAIRAQGPGGQHVNKVSSAVQLRFDVRHSSLPDAVQRRLLASQDSRLSKDGVMIIKAQRYRSAKLNREEALARLREWVLAATHQPKARKKTKPTRGSQLRRLDSKTRHGQKKNLRGKITD